MASDSRRKPLSEELANLWRLAKRCGVMPAFVDVESTRRRASPEALMATLRSLGVAIERAGEAADALREVEQQHWREPIEPIIVQWQGESAMVDLRLPDERANGAIELRITHEDGSVHGSHHAADELATVNTRTIEGQRFRVLRLSMPGDLAPGYYDVQMTAGGSQYTSRLIVASRRVPSRWAARDERAWGVFVPLYALRSEQSWGAGDLHELERLMTWAGEHGADVVGTLPLLALYLGHGREPCDPSPYWPASRLFFCEMYLNADAHDVPGADRAAIDALREGRFIEYEKIARIKRQATAREAERAWSDERTRSRLERAASDDAVLGEYARFRAVVERHGPSWRSWARDLHDRIRSGTLTADDADVASIQHHLYAQTILRTQLQRLNSQRPSLYLDLPVGIHPNGFDAWRYASSFAPEVSAGAPPDELFRGGQDWGFPPLHPWQSRATGHEWFVESVRRHLDVADALRIDHVMCLHRLYWIPHGFAATDGVYVRHPSPEEFYAILALEAHRRLPRRIALVGENLGTVPGRVNRAMARHGIHGLHVGQFAVQSDQEQPLHPPPAGSVASMNTHDTPTFAGFWHGRDIDERVSQGVLEPESAEAVRERRAAWCEIARRWARSREADAGRDGDAENQLRDVLASLLEEMSGREAALVLISLEDLWLEEQPQNRPGTSDPSNWSRRAAMTMEAFMRDPFVIETLRRINRARKNG